MSRRVMPNIDLDFLWLELTNRCNENCHHCSNESGSARKGEHELSKEEWIRVMREAAKDGIKRIQFIGGEPLIVKFLAELIVKANELGFTYIEVYTNATLVTRKFIELCKVNNVCIATSLYSFDPAKHDAMTQKTGSHTKTISAIQMALEVGLLVRVSVMPSIAGEKGDLDRTVEYIKAIGVTKVSVGSIQPLGRAENLFQIKNSESRDQCDGLCGHCWDGSVCVTPNGDTFPCTMARKNSMGNALENRVSDLYSSDKGVAIRSRIYEWAQEHGLAGACPPDPSGCTPKDTLLGRTGACPPNPSGCTPKDVLLERTGACPPKPGGQKEGEIALRTSACPPKPTSYQDETWNGLCPPKPGNNPDELIAGPCPPKPNVHDLDRDRV